MNRILCSVMVVTIEAEVIICADNVFCPKCLSEESILKISNKL